MAKPEVCEQVSKHKKKKKSLWSKVYKKVVVEKVKI